MTLSEFFFVLVFFILAFNAEIWDIDNVNGKQRRNKMTGTKVKQEDGTIEYHYEGKNFVTGEEIAFILYKCKEEFSCQTYYVCEQVLPGGFTTLHCSRPTKREALASAKKHLLGE